jgi:methyl-accepting chemotaxis protein
MNDTALAQPHEANLLADTGGVSAEVKLALSASSIQLLNELLPKISALIDENVGSLAESFSGLAEGASSQSSHLQKIVGIAGRLNIEEESVTIDEFNQMFSNTLTDVIEKILSVSSMAMEMTYAMDDAMAVLDSIDTNITDIQKVTRQSHMLALNALIEAERAGEAGRGFSVVAEEVKQISNRIAQVSLGIRERVGKVDSTIRFGYKKLRDLATTDMSDNILAKEKLQKLAHALFEQNEEFKDVLNNSAENSQAVAENIGRLTVSLQFQDRLNQYIENISWLFAALQEVLAEQENPPQGTLSEEEKLLAEDLSNRLLLSELKNSLQLAYKKHPLLKQAAQELALAEAPGNGEVTPSTEDEDDDIELF